jgi:hypothetical protein
VVPTTCVTEAVGWYCWARRRREGGREGGRQIKTPGVSTLVDFYFFKEGKGEMR